MKYDVIIIGSGLGGLECAHILSKAGKRVLVLEKEAQPGGCVQSYRRNGLTFDTGFHYVGGLEEGQSLYAAFSMLGLMALPCIIRKSKFPLNPERSVQISGKRTKRSVQKKAAHNTYKAGTKG